MRTRVKDFIDISDYTSLDRLITTLVAIRDSLPETADPELKMRGDDVFGRRLSICYSRPQTAEEAECDARYANAYRESRQREPDRLQVELGFDCRAPRKAGPLPIVA